MRASVTAPWPEALIAALVAVVLVIAAAGQIGDAASPPRSMTDSDRLRAAIARVLPPDSGRGVPRLSSVRIDPTGDATVVFALRAGDSAQQIVNAGTVDILAILRAIYHPVSVASVRTATVIGTYAVAGQYGTREWPVMRAVLSRQSADRLDWIHLTPNRLPAAVDTWWVYPPLLAAAPESATPAATPSVATPAP